MLRFCRVTVLCLAVLIAFAACDVLDDNLMGTPSASISAIGDIASTTSRVNVVCTSSYDEESDTSLVSISITGVLSTAFELEGDYSFEDDTYIWLTSLSDDEITSLAETLEKILKAGGSSKRKLLDYLSQDAPEEYAEAVNSTCTLLSDMLSDFNVSQLELEDDTIDELILLVIDSIGTLSEGTISMGEMLILRLISTDVISVLIDSATQLQYYYYYGLDITAIDQDGLIDIFKDSADYLLSNFAIVLTLSDLICDDSDFASAVVDLYDYVGDYITSKVED